MGFEDSKGYDDAESQTKEQRNFSKVCDFPENPPKEHRIPFLVLGFKTIFSLWSIWLPIKLKFKSAFIHIDAHKSGKDAVTQLHTSVTYYWPQ